MAQQPDTLDAGLIRKGEARGVNPALATPAASPAPSPQADGPFRPHQNDPEPIRTVRENRAVGPAAGPSSPPHESEPDPTLRALPPDDVPKRFTSFRLPVTREEDLRAMIFETRRTKQDLDS